MDPHQAQSTQYYQLQDGMQEKTGQFVHQHQPYQPYQQPYQVDDGGPDAASSGATILSVKRSAALVVTAVLAFLFLAVIGLSAGLGVSQRDLHRAQSELDLVQAIVSSAVAAGAAGATTVFLAPTTTRSAAATSTVVIDVQCPQVNGTVYTASTGGKRFRRMCGIDYGGEGEAVDIRNVKTRNLDACIDECASTSNCTGAGWGVIEGDKSPLQSCWMKTNLTKSHKATPDWGFAVLVPTEGESQ